MAGVHYYSGDTDTHVFCGDLYDFYWYSLFPCLFPWVLLDRTLYMRICAFCGASARKVQGNIRVSNFDWLLHFFARSDLLLRLDFPELKTYYMVWLHTEHAHIRN